MTSKHMSVERVFNAALAKQPAAERDAYLDGACANDPSLRARVEALLAAHDEQGSFLLPVTEQSAAPLEQAGTMIGRYKLLQLIGEGGFGAVYMAEQEQPVRRKVALKIIKLGMDTKQVIARFEAERQALALMDHPNIAKVLDAGATDSGRPYFVMELVRGIPITEYCDQNNLSTRQRLSLFLQVCHAVQHAHQKGIIHRDLKPTNVMVTLHDGTPVPKIIDFGISKATNQRLTERTLFTEYHQFIGTPAYMSPEQAEMSGLDIDTRSDLYSLGVLLYELLTGTTPFDANTLREAGYGEIQRIIREIEPPKPSTRVATLVQQGTDVAKRRAEEPAALSRLMRGDLDWIVMKAMEKDRTRRYATASEFAGDVRRYLDNEPVLAGPPSVKYKLSKFIQRHRLGVIASGVVAAALIIGIGLATVGFLKASRDRDRANVEKERADEQARRSQAIADFLQEMLVSTDPESAAGLDVDVENVVSTAREVFGDDHATVAATLSSLSVQLQSTGNYSDAEPLQQESLRIWRRLYGDDNLNVGIGLRRLGTMLRFKGDEAAAEKAFDESLRITEALPHEGGVATADTLLQFADVLTSRGAYSEAEAALRKSLRIRKEVAPHQRLEIAVTLNIMANVMVVGGQMDEVEGILDETLAAFRQALPEDSNLIAKVATEVGAYKVQQGNLDGAEALLREALEIYGQSDAPGEMHREMAVRFLARIVSRRDDESDEYVQVREQFVEYLRGILGEHALLGKLLADYADDMHDRDRPRRAISMGIESLALLGDGPDEQRHADAALETLASATWTIARDATRSAEDYRIAENGAEAYLSRKPDDFAVVNTLGILQYRLGSYDEALATLARSDERHSKREQGAAPADVAFLAMTHHQLGRHEEAQAALARLENLMHNEKHHDDPQSLAFLAEARQLIEPETPTRSDNGS